MLHGVGVAVGIVQYIIKLEKLIISALKTKAKINDGGRAQNEL